MKFCKDCKYHSIDDIDLVHLCLRRGMSKPCMVTGESLVIKNLCINERSSVLLCGEDAKYFVKKDLTDAK